MKRVVVMIGCLAAMGVSASAAQAVEPHWKWANPAEEIPAGKAVTINTEGKIYFSISVPGVTKPLKLNCAVRDEEEIENPLGGGAGVDRMLTFIISCSSKKTICATGTPLELTAVGLPWTSQLVAGAPPTDVISGVEIEATCSGSPLTTFKGTLSPTIKGYSGLSFSGPASGTLTDGSGKTMTLKGKDKLIGPPPKTKIGVI